MRGKHRQRTDLLLLCRITPADAGKTMVCTCGQTATEDHPRGCGENSRRSKKNRRQLGSPPRMRGKRLISYGGIIKTRITPADAGKTVVNALIVSRSWDHPRGCGENVSVYPSAARTSGSPPRMRGKRNQTQRVYRRRRITPADAGKTQFLMLAPRRDQDHPRGCGENDDGDISRLRDIGSPPRMRGKPSIDKTFRVAKRITPADAGKVRVQHIGKWRSSTHR